MSKLSKLCWRDPVHCPPFATLANGEQLLTPQACHRKFSCHVGASLRVKLANAPLHHLSQLCAIRLAVANAPAVSKSLCALAVANGLAHAVVTTSCVLQLPARHSIMLANFVLLQMPTVANAHAGLSRSCVLKLLARYPATLIHTARNCA